MEKKLSRDLIERDMKIEKLTSDLQKLKEEHLNVNCEFEEQIKLHDSEAKTLVDHLTLEKYELENKIQQDKTSMDMGKRKEEEFIRQIVQLNGQIASKNNIYQLKNCEIEKLSHMLQNNEAEINKNNTVIAQLRKTIGINSNSNNRTEASMHSLISDKESLAEEINTYKSKCEALKQKSIQFESELQNHSQHKSEYQSNEINFTAQNESLKAELQRTKMQVAFLQAQLQTQGLNIYPIPPSEYKPSPQDSWLPPRPPTEDSSKRSNGSHHSPKEINERSSPTDSKKKNSSINGSPTSKKSETPEKESKKVRCKKQIDGDSLLLPCQKSFEDEQKKRKELESKLMQLQMERDLLASERNKIEKAKTRSQQDRRRQLEAEINGVELSINTLKSKIKETSQKSGNQIYF